MKNTEYELLEDNSELSEEEILSAPTSELQFIEKRLPKLEFLPVMMDSTIPIARELNERKREIRENKREKTEDNQEEEEEETEEVTRKSY